MNYTKITQADLTGKGVIGLPDTPNLSTTDIQEKFDEIALDVIVPKFNDLSDELDASDIDSAIKSADITDMRLNADMAIEVSDDHGSTWSGTASSGHRIMDGSGTIYTQESKLQFSNNVTIQDDSVNGITKVLIQPGEKGDPGKAATITIGDVTEGQSASVVNVGSQTDAIFNITLPKGDPGDAATIAVGTVTSGATASVINSGTSDAAVFNFVLPKGDQGDPGTGLTLLGTYATYADLIAAHPTGQRGNSYFVGDDTLGYVYLWDPDTSAWVNIGELKGPKGNTGATPSLSIGTVQTGSSSAVTITGTTDYPVLNFTLEQGDKGDTGNAGTIAVGSVTSGATASVTNSGTSTAAVFDFVLPKGDKGDQGNPTTVNGKSGNNVTLYGTDIDISSVDNTKLGDIKGGAFLDTNVSGGLATSDSLASIYATGATNTTGSTISAGTYFYLEGTLVRGLTDIANGATFTLNTNYEVVSVGALNCGSLLSRPDLWTVGTEYNFGNGLYGQRLQPTIIHTATGTGIITATGITGVNKIVNFGGDFQYASTVRLCVPYCDYNNESGSSKAIFAMPQVANGEINIYTKTNSASNLTWNFDIWFLYKK